MKIDVISRGGRKKDFWDIHYLLDFFSLKDMIALHQERSEWTHNESEILSGLLDFSLADEMPDPMCLLQKDWDFIKMDFIDTVNAGR